MYMCTHKLQMIQLFIFVLNCTRNTEKQKIDNVVVYFIPNNQFHNNLITSHQLSRKIDDICD